MLLSTGASAEWGERSTADRALYTVAAVAGNVLPVIPAFAAPTCLPGYLFCKAAFAAGSLIAAGEHLVMSGGGDLEQTKALLYRGFRGDWILRGAHLAGDERVAVLPDPPTTAPGAGEPGGVVP